MAPKVSAAAKAIFGQAAVRGCRFQSQCVFQFVGRVAQFAEAASRRVALDGVDDAPYAAHQFRVRRVPFQLQRLFIQRLQQFLRGLEKEFPHFRAALIGETGSCRHLNLLVGGPAVAMDHDELVGQGQQAFRMADEQVAL